ARDPQGRGAEALGVDGPGDAAARGGVVMGARAAVSVMVTALVCGVACGGAKPGGEPAEGVEKPALEAWAPPIADVPKLAGAVLAIAEDMDGVLWFGTSEGVNRYDPKSGAWSAFTSKD